MKTLLAVLAALVLTAPAGNVWADEPAAPRVNLDVRDADVKTVLTTIAKEAGLNLAVTDRVRRTLTLTLKDVTPEEAMRAVARAADATLVKDGEVYLVDHKLLPPTRAAATASVASVGIATAPPLAGAASAAQTTTAPPSKPVLRLIHPRFLDAAMLASAFGGSVIGGGMYGLGSQGFGRAGSGGYGGPFGRGGGRGNGSTDWPFGGTTQSGVGRIGGG